MKISYNVTQLLKAAEFIWNNNPSVQHWPDQPRDVSDVARGILKLARKQAERNVQMWQEGRNWSTFVGTGGYTIMLTSDSDFDDYDNIVVDLDILVDPAIGVRGSDYATQEVYDESEYE